MRIRWFVGLAAIAPVLAVGAVLFGPASPPRLIDYRHHLPGGATVVVAGAPSAAFAISGKAVPAVLDSASVNDAVVEDAWTQTLPVEREFDIRRARFSLELHGAEAFAVSFREDESSAASEQNHVVVFYPLGCVWLPRAIVPWVQATGLCRSTGHVEIIRQSQAFLKSMYNLDKHDGYSIAGRRSIALPRADEEKSAEVVGGNPIPLLHLPRVSPEAAAAFGDGHHELKQAARLVEYLYQQPIRVGPSSASTAAADAADRIAAIRGGSTAVQCQGFRDIWLELAVRVPGIDRVRAVGAYNYFPPFSDLVTFSHALAEIYVRDEGRWILIDPWFGFSLRHAGRFLSVETLAALRQDENATIDVVPLVGSIRRFTVGADQSPRPSTVTVSENAPPLRSRFADGRYQFGYLDYFESLSYGPEYRRRGAVTDSSK